MVDPDLDRAVNRKVLELREAGVSVSWTSLVEVALRELLKRKDASIASTIKKSGVFGYRRSKDSHPID